MRLLFFACLIIPSAVWAVKPFPPEGPKPAWSVPEIAATFGAKDLIGRSQEEVLAARPGLILGNYSSIGPIRTEEFGEAVELPFPAVLYWVFEGAGKKNLRRILIQPREPWTRERAESIRGDTAASLGKSERTARPYDLESGGMDMAVEKFKRMLKRERRAQALTVDYWKAGENEAWLSETEVGYGRPVLASVRFAQETVHLAGLAAVILLILSLLVYGTPVYESSPKLVHSIINTLFGAASTLFWAGYPLGTVAWFMWESHQAGYF